MSKENNLQISFLSRIKEQLPTNASIADELADVLNVSIDSVYRRLRGETALTISEIHLLCSKYKISFDSFADSFETIPFEYGRLMILSDLHLI
jgi:transcriptional regulator with XRE-family HTH domain